MAPANERIDAPPGVGTITMPLTPFVLRLDCQDFGAGLWPAVGSEADLMRRLSACSSQWDFSQVVNRHADDGRLVTSLVPLPYEQMCEREREAQALTQAKRALRKVTRPAQAPGTGARSNIKRRKPRTAVKARGSLVASGSGDHATIAAGRSSSSHSEKSTQSEDSEVEKYLGRYNEITCGREAGYWCGCCRP